MNLPVKQSSVSALMDPATFEQMHNVGRLLAASPLFPDHLRQGPDGTALANGVLVMNMAIRLNEDPLTVAQNIYFVSGKPGWSSSYMISKANQFGVFKDPIDWEITGEGKTLSVTAFAEMDSTGRRVEATCSMEMAMAEGWTKNKKYQSMPEQMLRYRSATFLIRLYCPEVMVGVPAMIEVESGIDYRDITPVQTRAAEPKPTPAVTAKKPTPKTKVDTQAAPAADDVQEAEVVEDEAQPTNQTESAPDNSQFEALYEMIRGDLMQCAAGDVDEVIGLYGEQVSQMEAAAPELHKKLMAEVANLKAAAK